ncbi:MAG: sel1 repeat family protein, partial [Ruminobacter sp.]|nr:sel1 repeat family protein [Ruminobacter sp.]
GEYAKACELDEPWGCYTLAYLYYDGDVAQNIFQDRNKALELFIKSCDLGYARGCITLAFDIDRRNAGTYLAKGCNKFHDKACCINLNTWGLGE